MNGCGWNDSSRRLVLFLDIMGFKERVRRMSVDKLKEQLIDFCAKKIKLSPLLEGKGNPDMMKITQFSDSIVVVSKGSAKEDLNRLTKAAVILMQNALEKGIALRGAIACGDMVFDERNQIFFGQALIDAYLLEKELCCYGIVFHDTAEELVAKAMQPDKHPIEDVVLPFKGGKSKHYHVAWYKMDKKLTKNDISNEALIWLNNLRKTVSGHSRAYLDNTIEIINNEENHVGLRHTSGGDKDGSVGKGVSEASRGV